MQDILKQYIKIRLKSLYYIYSRVEFLLLSFALSTVMFLLPFRTTNSCECELYAAVINLICDAHFQDHFSHRCGATLAVILFTLRYSQALIFLIVPPNVPSLNVLAWSFPIMGVVFCFLRSVAVGVLRVKLLHCSDVCAFAKSNNRRRCVKKKTMGKRKPVFSVDWELVRRKSRHQRNVIAWAPFVTRSVSRVRGDGVENCEERFVTALEPKRSMSHVWFLCSQAKALFLNPQSIIQTLPCWILTNVRNIEEFTRHVFVLVLISCMCHFICIYWSIALPDSFT